MDSIFVAAASLFAGILLRLLGRLPEGSNRIMAGVVIQFCVPPVAFLAARTMPLTAEGFLPGSMAWILFAGGFLFFGLAARLLGLSRQTFGCLMLAGGMSNTIFIGHAAGLNLNKVSTFGVPTARAGFVSTASVVARYR